MTIWKNINRKLLHQPFWTHAAIIAKTPTTINAIPPPNPNPKRESTKIWLILTNWATVAMEKANTIATPTKIMLIEMMITNHLAHFYDQQHIKIKLIWWN